MDMLLMFCVGGAIGLLAGFTMCALLSADARRRDQDCADAEREIVHDARRWLEAELTQARSDLADAHAEIAHLRAKHETTAIIRRPGSDP